MSDAKAANAAALDTTAEESNVQRETIDGRDHSDHSEPSDPVDQQHAESSNHDNASNDSQDEDQSDTEVVATAEERPENYNVESNQQDAQATEESAWVPTWDEESQAYYWWNTITNETTWDNPYPDQGQDQEGEEEQAYYDQSYQGGYYYGNYEQPSNPLDAVLSKIDTEVRSQLDNTTDTSKPFQSYNELFDPAEVVPQEPVNSYDSVAHFNARTGKFTSSKEADRLNPEYMSLESRAKRQMQYYFDVDAYQEQRNRERMANAAGAKRPLSKKEVERFKRQKQEKKEKRKREWLSKDHD
ncbi:hypothetical protein Unana1_02409 [Umbelopsis nana]